MYLAVMKVTKNDMHSYGSTLLTVWVIIRKMEIIEILLDRIDIL